tara:strand:- start:10630 stop:11037 length:408 start_codon:yes stop_codon:yes gene_type:complete
LRSYSADIRHYGGNPASRGDLACRNGHAKPAGSGTTSDGRKSVLIGAPRKHDTPQNIRSVIFFHKLPQPFAINNIHFYTSTQKSRPMNEPATAAKPADGRRQKYEQTRLIGVRAIYQTAKRPMFSAVIEFKDQDK